MKDSELGIHTWQRIADFIGVSTWTAKRYHRRFGMPVYRTPGGVPYAIPDQLRLWFARFNEIKNEKMKKT